MSALIIRKACADDFDTIAAIYTDEVLHGLATFETDPPSVDVLTQRWRTLTDKQYPYLVATIENKVVGYAYAGPYRARAAYRNSIENSVYIDKTQRGKGLGKRLLEQLIAECEKGPWRQIIAVIGNSGNSGSIGLHKSLGFREVGTIESVGYKLDQWVDTVIMQRPIGDAATSKPDHLQN